MGLLGGVGIDRQCGDVGSLCWRFLVLLTVVAFADLAANWWCGYFVALFYKIDESLNGEIYVLNLFLDEHQN